MDKINQAEKKRRAENAQYEKMYRRDNRKRIFWIAAAVVVVILIIFGLAHHASYKNAQSRAHQQAQMSRSIKIEKKRDKSDTEGKSDNYLIEQQKHTIAYTQGASEQLAKNDIPMRMGYDGDDNQVVYEVAGNYAKRWDALKAVKTRNAHQLHVSNAQYKKDCQEAVSDHARMLKIVHHFQSEIHSKISGSNASYRVDPVKHFVGIRE